MSVPDATKHVRAFFLEISSFLWGRDIILMLPWQLLVVCFLTRLCLLDPKAERGVGKQEKMEVEAHRFGKQFPNPSSFIIT